ncbi:hypothetical protein [Novipirellula galeiformis]|uniref:hypothetical protein n=1 Tax=Novipirellula galeiformis TaxID=2528004 RepID=UPI0011B7A776|nr:hypothetical protein [Novipirellula galeiformis]
MTVASLAIVDSHGFRPLCVIHLRGVHTSLKNPEWRQARAVKGRKVISAATAANSTLTLIITSPEFRLRMDHVSGGFIRFSRPAAFPSPLDIRYADVIPA